MENSDNHFDYLVIGAGSGGVGSGRWTASKHGTKVAIIEHQRLGGTCVNVGCVPKKVMFNCSSFYEDLHMSDTYGFSGYEEVKLDFPTLKKHRDGYIEWLNGIYGKMLDSSNVTLIRGWAKFVDNKTVEVDGKKYTADHILIATGSHPNKIGFEGEEHTIDSDGFFEIEDLPKKFLILGGGYIAVEIGQVLHGLGTEVIQLARSEILTFADHDARKCLEKSMELSKYDLRKGITIQKVGKFEFIVRFLEFLISKFNKMN